jgi:thiol:disulfide interchange protein
MVLGGTALFAMALGMGVPLMLVGFLKARCCRAPAPGWWR